MSKELATCSDDRPGADGRNWEEHIYDAADTVLNVNRYTGLSGPVMPVDNSLPFLVEASVSWHRFFFF